MDSEKPAKLLLNHCWTGHFPFLAFLISIHVCKRFAHLIKKIYYQSISLNEDDDEGYGYVVLLDIKALNRPGEGEDWVFCIYRIDGG